MIPMCDLTRQYRSLKSEIDAAMQDVAGGSRYILGPNVKAFEKEMAEYVGCRHAVGVGSGTDALHLSLKALGIGPGDEVITTPFTFVATSEAICMAGARPVFVDIDPVTFNIDPCKIEPAITDQTRAILPVHLYGQPCDMDAISLIAEKHDLSIIEDCAQAIGAKYKGRCVGTFGGAGCFSFFPSKNLGGMGDGGMVTTNSPEVFERVEMLRRHGGRVKYHHSEVGLNSRLDELQAAILRIKLRHLNDWNNSRREHAECYNRLIEGLPGVVRPSELSREGTVIPTQPGQHDESLLRTVYHQYTLLVDDRQRVQEAMQAAEVGCLVYYPVPLHLQEVHAGLGYHPGSLPVAENVADRCVSIPMFPELSELEQRQVVQVLQKVAGSSSRSLPRAA